MVLLGLIVSLFIAIQDPAFQKFTARYISGYLSKKTGGEIKVGRLMVAPDFTIFLDDVVARDLKNNELVNVGILRTRLNISELLNGKIHVENVILSNVKANLVKYEGEEKFNFAFLVDAFATDTVKSDKASISINVGDIQIRNLDFVYWNQNQDNPEKTRLHLMDYSHIVLDDINLMASDFCMYGDSIHAKVGALSGSEISGLSLNSFEADIVVCQQGIYIDGLMAALNGTRIDADVHMLYNGFASFSSFIDSVFFDATIRPSDIMLSDVGVFSQIMYKMPNRLRFEGRMTGPIEHFSVNNLKAEFGEATVIEGDLSMHPLDFNDGVHELNISRLQFAYDDLKNFYIPSSTKTIPLPESLRSLKTGWATVKFKGSYNNFDSKIQLVSGIGNVDVDLSRLMTKQGDNVFSGRVNADNVNAGLIANAEKIVGTLDLYADFVARLTKRGSVDLTLKGNAYQAELLGHCINEIILNGDMRENRFKGTVSIDDKLLGLDFNGLIDFKNKKYPVVDFEAKIDHADLKGLDLIKKDSISEITTHIIANLRGFDIDNLEGELHIDNTIYRDGRGNYRMNRFDGSIQNDNLMQRRINIICDFFNFEMAGQINFASLLPVLNEYGDSFVHIPVFENNLEEFNKYASTHDVEQDFIVSLLLKDTRTLSRLFIPNLKIAKNTSVNGTFTSRSRQLNLTARAKQIEIGGVSIDNVELRNFNNHEASYGSLSVGRVGWSNNKETDTLSFGLDNLLLFAKMSNDTISMRFKWDDVDEADHNKALIETQFHPHENGGIFNIRNVDVVINDSLWNVSTNNYIDIDKGRVNISNLMFSHHLQSVRLDGYVPLKETDTITVQLRDFDISDFDFLTKNWNFDLDGLITGETYVSSLKVSPMVLTNLKVHKLGIGGELIGEADIESMWDTEGKSLDLGATIFNDKRRMLYAYGSYYTARKDNNLDFNAIMDSLCLSVLSPFLGGVASHIKGYGNGVFDIKGSLKQLDVNGRISITDGGCKINYLNTYYAFNPTIVVDNQTISFENMVLVDTLGNTAHVEGEIRHNRFKDFYLDMKLYPKNFLALATTNKDNDTFYGTAVADGVVTIRGPFNDLYLGIKARTKDGTSLTIPLNRASTVKENDYIIFVAPPTTDTVFEVDEEPELKNNSNFAIGLDVDATDLAKLKITLPGNLGTIETKGEGNVKLNTSTTEPLLMYGNYTISSGRFQLTLMDVLTRTFNLKKGGSISWSGSPTDGHIDATGVYSVKANLIDLGFQIDSTASSSSTVNVECLIHLKDQLLNPNISFGMRLPNASEDVLQTVFSVLDTTNQTMMTDQAISLLVFGKFAYAGGSAGATQTMSLSGLLSTSFQFDITKNMNLGLSYRSGSIDTFDEYQVAFRTELFENRLTIETNVGVMSSNNSEDASNIVGEFDLYYKLSKDGRLQAHFYNHSNYNTNYNSFAIDKRAPYTQGLGLSYSKSFPTFRELFRKKNALSNQPLIRPKN